MSESIAIPAALRRIVKSLKEVVSCPEPEIYAMLKDCNMDPNEAVNRLLAQDPFHEVKSKREKKKENKHTTEPKSRGANNHSSRGGKSGSDHYVGRSGTQFSSSDSGTQHGKPTYKKENGSSGYGSYSSVSSGTTGNNVHHRPPVHSDYVAAENKATFTDTVDGGWGSVPSSGFSQPAGNQPVWGGGPGQVSMADIVKMGRPQPKPSSTGNQPSSYHDVNSAKVSPNDEWPLVEPSTGTSYAVQPSSDWPTDASHLTSNIDDQHWEPEQGEVPAVEDASVENISANYDGYASVSSGRIQNNVDSHFDHDVYENMESFQPHVNAIEQREAEDFGVSMSSVTANLQQLKVVDEREALYEEEEAAVIIPNHLQVQTSDCLHLSFGSFGSLSAGPASSVPFSSRPTDNSIEEASAGGDDPSVGHLDTRNSDYYGDETLRTGSDGNLVHRTGRSGATAYDAPSVSQSEVLNQESHEGHHENQYDFPSSTNYSFENVQQLHASFPSSQNSAEMQTFSNHVYANTLPSSLLGGSAQSARDSDYPFSPFAMGQSMPAKYGNTVSSVSSSTASMPEVLKAAGFSSTLQSPQNLSGSNIATGPALPHHLMQQYSQVAPFANMIGYPFLPQNYYLPGAYQQTFASNNAYHQQSPGLPQYKNSVSVSSLPQSAPVASGYGGSFGSSTSLPGGNFSTNQPSAPPANYEDVLSSQYKDTSHLLSLQQNENQQAMYLHGHGSRTMSGIPANTYYSYQGHNQQQQPPSGFRQNQQPSQNYGAAIANSNFYHSQLLDHQQQQQQNLRDGSLVGSQVQANKQQSQQLWQNSY